ncbi:uncharacterized protein LOC136085573 [Hydra vulgaris]|uniref:Uncharacterized protein LOC136085573 n=1 Tax=Hydra vulgaris TaxID=6087 RepID=A0ABM4CMD3_HYDVU
MQKGIVNIVGPALVANLQPLSRRRNVASLSIFDGHYNGHSSKELASPVPSTKIHSRVTSHSIKSHPFFATVPKCSQNSYSSSFFPRVSGLRNSHPSSCFPELHNLQSFNVFQALSCSINFILSLPAISNSNSGCFQPYWKQKY